MGKKISEIVPELFENEVFLSYLDNYLKRHYDQINSNYIQDQMNRVKSECFEELQGVRKRADQFEESNRTLSEEKLHLEECLRREQEEKEALKVRLSEQIDLCKATEDSVFKTEQNNADLMAANNRLNDEILSAQAEIRTYKEKYSGIEKLYSDYQKCEFEIKNDIKNIFIGENHIAFITTAMQKSNLEAFWNYLRYQVLEKGSTASLNYCIELFLNLVNFYNETMPDCIQIIEPKEGEKFDSDNHIPLGKCTDGVIGSCVLPGYKTKVKCNKALITLRGDEV